jgi:heat shock protein HslJ
MKRIRFAFALVLTATMFRHTIAASAVVPSLIGTWDVASVKEDGKEIVSAGNKATLEFLEDGTFLALGGCNTMEPTQTFSVTGSKITFKPAGTKKSCASNVVEFWKLGKVTDFELQDDVLFLSYKTNAGKPGYFRLEKTQR